jgi:hypothetical protein
MGIGKPSATADECGEIALEGLVDRFDVHGLLCLRCFVVHEILKEPREKDIKACEL